MLERKHIVRYDSDVHYTKRKVASNAYYRKLKKYARPIVMSKFHPIVLNRENLIKTSRSTIFVPNHFSSMDSIVITAVLGRFVRWVMLKRFFNSEDDIFDKRKKSVLHKAASTLSDKLEFFSLEITNDNPRANNIRVIRDIEGFLRIGSSIGVMGEGTENKESYSNDFDSFFLRMAKKHNAWVQPITVLWIKELNLKEKVLINIGSRFKIEGMSIQEAMDRFWEIQQSSYVELKDFRDNLLAVKINNNVV